MSEPVCLPVTWFMKVLLFFTCENITNTLWNISSGVGVRFLVLHQNQFRFRSQRSSSSCAQTAGQLEMATVRVLGYESLNQPEPFGIGLNSSEPV